MVEWYVQMFFNLYVGVVLAYSPSVIFVLRDLIFFATEPLAFVCRVGLLFLAVAFAKKQDQ